MSTMNKLHVLTLGAAAFWLAGCGGGVQQSANASPSAVSSKAMSTDWMIAQQKHNNSGIAMRYRLSGKPAVGQALQVQLEFSGATQDDAGVEMRLEKALAVSAESVGKMGKTSTGFAMPLSKAQTTAHTLSITPQSEGMYYINFQLGQGGRQSAVSIAVPVGDGPFATPTTGQVQTLPSGEKIIVMPAK
jgi:hypothetical protein